MTPPHIALAAANISLDASRRIVDLLASRPVDAALIAEAAQIAHEADVKVRALLPGPPAPSEARAPVLSTRTPAESFADAAPTLSVPIRAEDVTITASPTYPDPTGWIRALRGPAASTAPADRRLQVLARLVDVAGAAVGLEDFVASTRAEYPDFTIEDLEDAVRALESDATTPPAVVVGPNVARSAGALDALAPGWSVDEPLDPSLWAQSLDRAQVAALAGERPSLTVQTEPREAGWLRDLVEPAPPSEAERIAAHVAAVAPGYRERARAWLDAEHADMVEDLAALMATVSAECCS